MGSIQLVIPKKEEPPALHDRAMDNLQYIRETMERASAFTGIPGWGQVAIGVTALASSFIAAQQKSFANWLAIWCAEAVVALLIAGWSMDRKARAAKIDRKSTRLNSSHRCNSYAVFCLKKKKE